MIEFVLYTGVATAAKIGPIYGIRNFVGKLFKIPILGWAVGLAYGGGLDFLLLKLFSFQSSMAGLANLLSSLILTGWMRMQKPQAVH